MSALYRDAEVVGHVSCGGCENHHCRKATAEGRPWHGTPMGFAVTMPTYHFATAEQAEAAVRAAMEGVAGRDPRLAVGEDTAWRSGTYEVTV